MKDVFFKLSAKVPTIIIQGESEPVVGTTGAWYIPYGSLSAANVYYRIKNDPNGVQWKDIYIEDNLAQSVFPAQFWVGYPLQGVNTVTYKVYVRAINDSKTVFSDEISFCTPITRDNPYLGTIPYYQIPLLNYAEMFVGTYTNTSYGYNSMFVVGANNTTSGANSITFDYIKLVPVLQ